MLSNLNLKTSTIMIHLGENKILHLVPQNRSEERIAMVEEVSKKTYHPIFTIANFKNRTLVITEQLVAIINSSLPKKNIGNYQVQKLYDLVASEDLSDLPNETKQQYYKQLLKTSSKRPKIITR